MTKWLESDLTRIKDVSVTVKTKHCLNHTATRHLQNHTLFLLPNNLSLRFSCCITEDLNPGFFARFNVSWFFYEGRFSCRIRNVAERFEIVFLWNQVLTSDCQNCGKTINAFVVWYTAFVFSWIIGSKRLETQWRHIFVGINLVCIGFLEGNSILKPVKRQGRWTFSHKTSNCSTGSSLQTIIEFKGFYFGWGWSNWLLTLFNTRSFNELTCGNKCFEYHEEN